MDDVYDYISLIICIATLVANLILNVGIVIAPCIDEALRNKRFAVLISLAIADLLKIISLISEIGSPFTQLETCQAIASLGFYLICVTVLHLVLESINRLVTIVRPLRYHELLTTKLVATLIAVLWILPILGIIIPHVLESDEIEWILSLRTLMFNCDQFYGTPARRNATKMALTGVNEAENLAHFEPADGSVLAYSAFITIVYFAIPLIVMVLSYSVIFNISLKHIRQIKIMEKDVRHLYHRISRSNLIVKHVSRTSSPTTNDLQSESPYRVSAVPAASHVTSSNEINDGENRSIDRQVKENVDRKRSKIITIEYDPSNWTESSSVKIETHSVANTNKVPEAKLVYDGNTQKSAGPRGDGRRRKVSNIVHPQNNDVEIAWGTNKSPEMPTDEHTGLSKDSFEEIQSDRKVEGDGALFDIPSKRRCSVIPVQASDVMANEYGAAIAEKILRKDTREVDDIEEKDCTLNEVVVHDLLVTETEDSGFATYKAAQAEDKTGGEFPKDISDNTNKKLRKTRMNTPLVSVEEDPPEITKQTTRSKLWKRVVNKSCETRDRKNEHVDRIPSEDAFIKIIELVEKKSKHPPHRFEENARRVMRYSALMTSDRRKRGEEEDEELGEPLTHAEVNEMESLLSIANSKENEQIASALQKTVYTSSSENQDQTIDAFSLLTAFPAMEAWAASLKAKATPNSNSFVRFYRVVRKEMRKREKEGKLVKTLGILFMAWIVFYVPVVAFSWQRLLRWPSVRKNDDGIGRLLFSWALLSSVFNPIIYSLRIPEFKKTLKTIYKTIKLHLYCR